MIYHTSNIMLMSFITYENIVGMVECGAGQAGHCDCDLGKL